jgi:hypothetical protein
MAYSPTALSSMSNLLLPRKLEKRKKGKKEKSETGGIVRGENQKRVNAHFVHKADAAYFSL